MPKNVPPELEEKFESCKEKVMEKGESEEAAYGICYVSVVEGKSIEQATKEYHLNLDALKVGARHSQKDNEALQQIHDGAVTLGAVCAPKPEVVETSILSVELNDDEVVVYGDAIKALGDGKRIDRAAGLLRPRPAPRICVCLA